MIFHIHHIKILDLFLKEHSNFSNWYLHIPSLYIQVRILARAILVFNQELIKPWKKKKAKNIFYRIWFRFLQYYFWYGVWYLAIKWIPNIFLFFALPGCLWIYMFWIHDYKNYKETFEEKDIFWFLFILPIYFGVPLVIRFFYCEFFKGYGTIY